MCSHTKFSFTKFIKATFFVNADTKRFIPCRSERRYTIDNTCILMPRDNYSMKYFCKELLWTGIFCLKFHFIMLISLQRTWKSISVIINNCDVDLYVHVTDHLAIIFDVNLKLHIPKKPSRKVYQFHKADKISLKMKLKLF